MTNKKWVVYDRIIGNEKFTKVEQLSWSKIEMLEKGMGKLENIIIFDRYSDAIKEWEDRTNGIIYKAKKENTNKSVPQALRKANAIHKLMDWKWKNNIA